MFFIIYVLIGMLVTYKVNVLGITDDVIDKRMRIPLKFLMAILFIAFYPLCIIFCIVAAIKKLIEGGRK